MPGAAGLFLPFHLLLPHSHRQLDALGLELDRRRLAGSPGISPADCSPSASARQKDLARRRPQPCIVPGEPPVGIQPFFDGVGTTPIPINEETQTKTQTTENSNRQKSEVL